MKKCFLIPLAALALAACSSDDEALSTGIPSDVVRIQPSIGEVLTTRTSPEATRKELSTQFDTNDTIMVSRDGREFYPYVYDGTMWNPVKSDTNSSAYLRWEKTDGETIDLQAYYPASASMTSFALQLDQDGKDSIAKADYMTFNNKATRGANNSVGFAMQRRMARVRVTIDKLGDQFPKDTECEVYIATPYVNITVSYNENDTTVSGESMWRPVKPYNSTITKGDTATAIVAPSTKLDKVFIQLLLQPEGSGLTALSVRGIPEHKAGYSYDYRLTVGKDSIAISSVTVTPWTDDVIDADSKANEILPPTVTKSGNTAIITMPEATLTDYVTEAANNAVNSGATTIVVTGSVSDEYYSIIANAARSRATVFFKDLTADNYITADDSTYTCTIGSASDDKYVLIVDELKSHQDNQLYYSDCIRKLEELTPGARPIDKDEPAFEQYLSKILSYSSSVTNWWLLANNKRGYWSSSAGWGIYTWSPAGSFKDTFYWYPVFDVPLS